MINIPYNKWTLKFYSAEHEAQYQEIQSQIKEISFRVLNLLMAFAALVCLIVFLVQKQPYHLVIVISGVVGGCFNFFLMSKKLKPYMTQVYSFMYTWSIFTNVIISFSGLEIPLFVFGFSSGCLAIVEMQFADNRLKILYIIVTPLILFGVFDVYKINTIQFVFQFLATMVVVAIYIYHCELTSRKAYSLNIIVNKQKDIIDEYVNEALFAVSLNSRTRQFILEFFNKKFEDVFGIKDTEQMKAFLRASFFVNKQTESIKKSSDFIPKKKQQTFEEFLFQKMKVEDIFSNKIEEIFDICYLNPTTEILESMQIQLKLVDYGKPVLIILVKSDQVPQLISNYEQQIKYYKQAILKQSQQMAAQLINVYKETKKTQISKDNQKIQLLQCLNLSIINDIRNNIIYYQKQKIYQQIPNVDFCKLQNYLFTIEQYLLIMSHYYKKKFRMISLVDKEQCIKLNTKYLTQIIINIFDQVLKYSLDDQSIILQIQEETNGNPYQIRKNTVSVQDSFRKVEQSQCGVDMKVLQFSYCFHTLNEIDLTEIDQWNIFNNLEAEVRSIPQQVTNLLLGILGPFNCSFQEQTSTVTFSQCKQFLIKLQFYVYCDQSLLDISYAKQIQEQRSQYQL